MTEWQTWNWTLFFDPCGTSKYALVCRPGEGNRAFHRLAKHLGDDTLEADVTAYGEDGWELWTVRVPSVRTRPVLG